MKYPDEIDAWLHTTIAQSCNLDCSYCFYHTSRKKLNSIKPKKIRYCCFNKNFG